MDPSQLSAWVSGGGAAGGLNCCLAASVAPIARGGVLTASSLDCAVLCEALGWCMLAGGGGGGPMLRAAGLLPDVPA